jgi:hypothetical protein
MADLSSIINVLVSRQTKGVTQVGFGIPLILGSSNKFSGGDVVRSYANMSGVEADFADTDPEYLAAQSIFAQQQTPTLIKIGYKAAPVSGHPTMAEALTAISAVDDTWYALLLTSRVDQDILDAAAYIEAKEKIFLACSASAGILTSGTTDIAAQLKTLNYSRTALLYSGSQATYPEAGWAGLCLPYDPGSETWKFKTIQGSAADNLTATQSLDAKGKNANTYETYAGVSITGEGTMADGEFIDVIRFVDWVKSRIQELVFATLINVPKVPYTDNGAAIIEAQIRSILLAGVKVGGLVDGSITVSVPKVAEQNVNDRAIRYMPGFQFQGILAGAIHKTMIQGVVTV